ncbi:response regulator [Pedosphaera parvula]|uniref:Response regulator receiver protein n=1 Tax=Pedosphaera parvula (strain Ellin514) TaxID=320771 RepID=B9XD78_PEDPL|nr:response regulator [Pedosphaera parvula]EEF62024.1 response regulator receiver protein [Pedosphaera parvula Ellin514]
MEHQADPAKQRHVLVVDDNAELALAFREALQLHGYEASVAMNGVQALKIVMQTKVDAILCELTMPQLDGDMFFNTLQRVRPALSRRFIFVTGNAGKPKYEPFLKNSSCPVLYKPVSADNLLITVAGLFTASVDNQTQGTRECSSNESQV